MDGIFGKLGVSKLIKKSPFNIGKKLFKNKPGTPVTRYAEDNSAEIQERVLQNIAAEQATAQGQMILLGAAALGVVILFTGGRR